MSCLSFCCSWQSRAPIDTKPLAKSLIDEFGSFADAIAAPVEQLRKAGVQEGTIAALKVVEAAALRLEGEGDGAPRALVMGSAARLLRRGDGTFADRRIPRAVPDRKNC